MITFTHAELRLRRRDTGQLFVEALAVRRLLLAAAAAISDELAASGPADVAAHPVLRAHARLESLLKREARSIEWAACRCRVPDPREPAPPPCPVHRR